MNHHLPSGIILLSAQIPAGYRQNVTGAELRHIKRALLGTRGFNATIQLKTDFSANTHLSYGYATILLSGILTLQEHS